MSQQDELNPLMKCKICGQQVRDSHMRDHFFSAHGKLIWSNFEKVPSK